MPRWLNDAVFYQVFPDRFYRGNDPLTKDLIFKPWMEKPTFNGFNGGNLWGLTEKLDELKELGINALYLNPIFQSASVHRYHTFDYFNVDPLLGGNEAFKFLLEGAHQRNMKVVLDGVFNHVGRGFWAFHHIMECGKDSPYLKWFHIKDFPLNAYTDIANYEAWYGIPALPKLNYSCPDVRKLILDVAAYWIDQGIDGWRLDVPNEIVYDFWPDFNQVVKYHNPEAYILGEIWADEIKNTSQAWVKPNIFDGVMNYGLMGAILGFFGGDSVKTKKDIPMLFQAHGGCGKWGRQQFENYINHLLQLYPKEVLSQQFNLIESHDTPRFLHLVDENKDILRLAYTFLFSFVGAPCLYYGSELGLSGGHDPDCRKTIPWGTSTLDFRLRDSLKKIIQLRNKHEEWRRGSFKFIEHDGGENILVYQREKEEELTIFILNVSSQKKDLRFQTEKPFHWNSLLGARDFSISGKTLFFKDVEPYETIIFKKMI